MKIFKNNSSRRGFLGAAALLSTSTPRLVAEELIKRPTAAAEIWARTELYFGTNKLQAEVTDSEFATFVDAEVTKQFPEGSTLFDGIRPVQKLERGAHTREVARADSVLSAPDT